MNIDQQYATIVQPSPFMIRQYRTPSQYLDPNKIIEERKKQTHRKYPQGKFKPSKRQKQFFIDQLIAPLKQNPAPSTYNVGLDLLAEKKASRKLINSLNPNALKNTYIDQIQFQQKKHKAPGVGKYNLLKLTDFTPVKKRNIQDSNPEKRNWIEGKVIENLQNPGPGNHNPHFIEKEIKPNMTNSNFYKQKHKEDELKIKRSLSAKLGPTTYNPVHCDTFDSIKIKFKQPQVSHWSKSNVQVRKGLRSEQKFPSPAEYQLINQWSSGKSSLQRSKSLHSIGKIRLFQRTIKTARSQSVYRD